MADEARNVEILRQAYQRWSDTLGGSADEWLQICSEHIQFASLAQAPTGAEYMTEYRSRNDLREYFEGLERDWQMIEFATEHFVAQGDRVIWLGRCAWRYKKTGKVVWTKKADSWRFADGKAIEYFEFFDTAQVATAVT